MGEVRLAVVTLPISSPIIFSELANNFKVGTLSTPAYVFSETVGNQIYFCRLNTSLKDALVQIHNLIQGTSTMFCFYSVYLGLV